MEEIIDKDLAKEIVTFLPHFNGKFVNRIPAVLLDELNELATESNKEFTIKKGRSLKDQNLSEDFKDFISYFYYEQFDMHNRDIIVDVWMQNE